MLTKSFFHSLLIVVLLLMTSCNKGSELIPSTKSGYENTLDTKPFEKWFSVAVDISNANARTSTDSSALKPSDNEFPLWKKAIQFEQSNAGSDLIVLPNLKRRGSQVVLQKLVLYRTNGKTEGFRVEFYPDGPQGNQINGSLKILSIDEKSEKTYKFKNGQDVSAGARKRIDLPADLVNVVAARYQPVISFSWSGGGGAWSYQFNDSVEPSNNGDNGNVDWPSLIEAMLQYIKDKILVEAQKNLNAQEMAILREMSIYQLTQFYQDVLMAQRVTGTVFRYNGGWASDGNHANAFKHALYSYLLADSFGRNTALQLLLAHENGEVSCNTTMDMKNNYVGLDFFDSGVRDASQAISALYSLALEGKLWVLGGDCVIQIPFRP